MVQYYTCLTNSTICAFLTTIIGPCRSYCNVTACIITQLALLSNTTNKWGFQNCPFVRNLQSNNERIKFSKTHETNTYLPIGQPYRPDWARIICFICNFNHCEMLLLFDRSYCLCVNVDRWKAAYHEIRVTLNRTITEGKNKFSNT